MTVIRSEEEAFLRYLCRTRSNHILLLFVILLGTDITNAHSSEQMSKYMKIVHQERALTFFLVEKAQS